MGNSGSYTNMLRWRQDEPPEYVTFSATTREETEEACIVDSGTVAAWILKSQLQINEDGTVTMLQSLATEKGFIA